MIRNCETCGKEFNALRATKNCSPQCSAVASVIRHKQYDKKFPEKYRARKARYNTIHRAQILEKRKQVRERDADKIKKYRDAHRENAKQYYETHRMALRDQHREYQEKHRKEITDKFKQRLRENVSAALNFRIANAIRKSMKAIGENKKGEDWFNIVGYSQKTLRDHLKKTMPVGSTWEDFLKGKLHIDHIIPLSAFNFTSHNDIDFLRAWNYKNLQLLTAEENLRKGAKLKGAFQPSLCLNMGGTPC